MADWRTYHCIWRSLRKRPASAWGLLSGVPTDLNRGLRKVVNMSFSRAGLFFTLGSLVAFAQTTPTPQTDNSKSTKGPINTEPNVVGNSKTVGGNRKAKAPKDNNKVGNSKTVGGKVESRTKGLPDPNVVGNSKTVGGATGSTNPNSTRNNTR